MSVQLASQIELALTPARPRQWTRGSSVPFEQWSMYRTTQQLPDRQALLIQGAYRAREAGLTVAAFVRSQRLTSENEVRECLGVLNKVFLLT